MNRPLIAAALLAPLLAFSASAARAQENSVTQDGGDQGGAWLAGAADAIGEKVAGAVGAAVKGGIGPGLDAWLTGSGTETVLRVAGVLGGYAVRGLKDQIGPLVDATAENNLMVTLPDGMTTDNGYVRDMNRSFTRATQAAAGGGLILLLLASGLRGALWGVTWDEARGAIPQVAMVLAGAQLSLRIADDLRRGANAVSLSLSGGAQHLPAWEQLTDVQQAAGEGLTAFATLTVGLLLAFSRAITVLLFDVCVVLVPLALFVSILPFVGHLGTWLLGKLLGALAVQWPQAVAIGIGNALVLAFGAGLGGFGAFVLGVGAYWLAFQLPRMLPGLDAHAAPGGLFGKLAGAGVAMAGGPATGAVGAVAGAGAAAGSAAVREVAHGGGAMGGGWSPGPDIITTFRPRPLAASTRLMLPAPG